MSKRKNNAMEDNASDQTQANEQQQQPDMGHESSENETNTPTDPALDFDLKLKEQEDKFLRLYA